MSSLILDSFMGVAWLLFMRRMLNTDTFIPKIDQFLKTLIGIYLLSVVAFIIDLQTLVQPAIVLYLVTVLLIIGIGFFCTFKRQRSAYFFVVASFILCFSTALNSLMILDLLPSNFVTINAM